LAWSPDKNYLAIKVTTSPYFHVYKRTGDSFSKIADPASVPSDVFSLEWSPDSGYLALGVAQAPYVFVYKRIGDVLTKLSNPASPPAGYVPRLAWSPSGTKLACLSDSYGGSRVYTLSDDVLTASTGSIPIYGTYTQMSIDWSYDSQFVAFFYNNSSSCAKAVMRASGGVLTEMTLSGAGTPVNSAGTLTNGIKWHPSKHLFVNTGDQYCAAYQLNAAETAFVYLGNTDTMSSAYEARAYWINDVELARTSWWNGLGYSSDYCCLLLYNFSPIGTKVTLDAVPVPGAAVTADYTVNGIHKTDQYIIDASFAIQFGEVI
jgi:WD40 repeat protein